MNHRQSEFLKLIKHPIRFKMFLFFRLPIAFLSGIKIAHADETKCIVSIPYKWLTQNPFRSAYFASLAMAAEMSTGILAMTNVYKRRPAISMLVTNMQATYFKKAIDKTFFSCEEGEQISATIEEAVTKSEPQSITVKSIGRNKNNDMIAEFSFTWSFKIKN